MRKNDNVVHVKNFHIAIFALVVIIAGGFALYQSALIIRETLYYEMCMGLIDPSDRKSHEAHVFCLQEARKR